MRGRPATRAARADRPSPRHRRTGLLCGGAVPLPAGWLRRLRSVLRGSAGKPGPADTPPGRDRRRRRQRQRPTPARVRRRSQRRQETSCRERRLEHGGGVGARGASEPGPQTPTPAAGRSPHLLPVDGEGRLRSEEAAGQPRRPPQVRWAEDDRLSRPSDGRDWVSPADQTTRPDQRRRSDPGSEDRRELEQYSDGRRQSCEGAEREDAEHDTAQRDRELWEPECWYEVVLCSPPVPDHRQIDFSETHAARRSARDEAQPGWFGEVGETDSREHGETAEAGEDDCFSPVTSLCEPGWSQTRPAQSVGWEEETGAAQWIGDPQLEQTTDSGGLWTAAGPADGDRTSTSGRRNPMSANIDTRGGETESAGAGRQGAADGHRCPVAGRDQWRDELCDDQSGPELCRQSGPELCRQSGPELCRQSGPELCRQSGPELCRQSGPELCRQSGPELCGQSGPELCRQSGPELCRQSGPEQHGQINDARETQLSEMYWFGERRDHQPSGENISAEPGAARGDGNNHPADTDRAAGYHLIVVREAAVGPPIVIESGLFRPVTRQAGMNSELYAPCPRRTEPDRLCDPSPGQPDPGQLSDPSPGQAARGEGQLITWHCSIPPSRGPCAVPADDIKANSEENSQPLSPAPQHSEDGDLRSVRPDPGGAQRVRSSDQAATRSCRRPGPDRPEGHSDPKQPSRRDHSRGKDANAAQTKPRNTADPRSDYDRPGTVGDPRSGHDRPGTAGDPRSGHGQPSELRGDQSRQRRRRQRRRRVSRGVGGIAG